MMTEKVLQGKHLSGTPEAGLGGHEVMKHHKSFTK